MTIRGLITAMATPMRDGSIDGEAVRGLVKRFIQKGANGTFILGANGKSRVLSREEKVKLAAMVVEYADCRVSMYAGNGGSSAQEVIELSRALQQTGTTVLGVITPFLVLLSQQGLLQHYEAAADVANISIILYSISKDTGNDIEP